MSILFYRCQSLECEFLFVTTEIDRTGKEAGIEQFRQTQELHGRETPDFIQINYSLLIVYYFWIPQKVATCSIAVT